MFVDSVDVNDGDRSTVVLVMLCDCLGEGGVDCFPRELSFGPVDKISGNVVVIGAKAVADKNFNVRVCFNLFIEVVCDSVLEFGCDHTPPTLLTLSAFL